MAAARGMLGTLQRDRMPEYLWEGALAESFGRRIARAILQEYESSKEGD